MNRMKNRLCAALEASLQGGKVRPPEGSAIIWNAFMSLSRARSCGPVGPNPITYPEIEAYTRLMRLPLEPQHVEAIAALDGVWLDRAYRAANVPPGVKVLPPASEHALTPEMFDLLG